MRAYHFNGVGIENLVQVDLPQPQAGPGQIVLRMTAASLNYRDHALLNAGLHGRIPLSDGVGEVVAVGEGVTRVALGDRVAGLFFPTWLGGTFTATQARAARGGSVDGMLAEYVGMDAESVIKVPEHLSDAQAATLPCAGLTAWNALFETGVARAGDTILVQGTGGVSVFALQFARLAGVRVLATSSSDAKLERMRAMGAEAGLNYRKQPDWATWAKELTGGNGVEQIIEVGGAGTLEASMKAIGHAGTISLIGVLSGAGATLPLVNALHKAVRLQGIYVGSREMFERMNRAITMHRLQPVVDAEFAFAHAADAFRHLAAAAHFGKIVIRF